MSQHLIFEGAELSGKSWLMSQIYDYLEPKYNQNKKVLDGCHWFNSDVGVYGTENGQKIIENYLKMFEVLKDKNLLIEKFYLSDLIYNRLHNNIEINYDEAIKQLKQLNFKIILITFPENKQILERRIKDRLGIYPHYERILQNVDWYINQQKEYLKEIKKIDLPYLIIETNILPDNSLTEKILNWIGEK